MRGRRPLPSHLKLVKGTARGELARKKRDDIQFEISLPMPPPFLNDDAKVEWGRVSSMLYAMRLLSNADVAALAAYCVAYSTWKQALESLSTMAKNDPLTKALMIKTSNGNAIQNPLLGIANRAAENMVKFAAEFGMTPSARARIHAGEGPNQNTQAQTTGAEKYFA